MIVGTAGHIDHGKTSLVRALTGVDTDRLPEERARGITIDLGFAYVPLADDRLLGFVDVPGHERLVHTMIAGASSVGMALLVVAADDGVMPQTREHLQILSLLGVTRGVVALTKTDLVDAGRALDVELEITALLEGTPLAGADVFPVSTVTGAGIPALRHRLDAEAAKAAAPAAEGRRFRLAVDRVFSLAGAGTIVTGSVLAGAVTLGETVTILPSGARARVRGIHAANRAVGRAAAGERCALNLIGPGVRKDAIGRGDWVVDPAGDMVSRRCDVTLRLLASERTALKHWTPVLVHHGAGQIPARVVLLAPSALRPGEEGLAQLVLDRPAPMRHGDRVVLRDTSASRTIAGGRVLDPRGPERHRHRPARLAVLRALTGGPDAAAVRGLLNEPPFLIARAALLADWGLLEAGLTDLCPDAVAAGGFIAAPAGLDILTRDLTDALAAFHARHPSAPGMTGETSRLAMPTRLPRDAFGALLGHLVATGAVAAEGHLLRAPWHKSGLTGTDARTWDSLRPLLADAPFRPPLLREAAAAMDVPEVGLRRACKGFARIGLVVEVAPDRFFLRDAVVGMAEAAHALSAEAADGAFLATAFRDRLGNGRQLAIQVLEYFDRRGITVRRGDARRAGKSPRAAFGDLTSGTGA